MQSKEIAATIMADVANDIRFVESIKTNIEALIEDVGVTIKGYKDLIADEAQLKEVAREIALVRLNQIVPVAEIQKFLNSRLPALIKPIAPIVTGQLVPKMEVDAMDLIINFIDGLIDKKFGADWFAKLKA